MVMAVVFILSETHKVESDSTSTNFPSKSIPTIDWNDGEATTSAANNINSTYSTSNEWHDGTTTNMASYNKNQLQLTTPNDTNSSNLSAEFDNISFIHYKEATVASEELLHGRRDHLPESTENVDFALSMPNTNWDDNSSRANNSYKTISYEEDDPKQLFNLTSNETDKSATIYIPNMAEKAREMPFSSMSNIFNASLHLTTPLPKLINSQAFFPKFPFEDDSQDEESNVSVTVLHNDDFIPFAPRIHRQIIQPIQTSENLRGPRVNDATQTHPFKIRRLRNRIKAIEMNSVITARPSGNTDGTLSTQIPLRARKRISMQRVLRNKDIPTVDIKNEENMSSKPSYERSRDNVEDENNTHTSFSKSYDNSQSTLNEPFSHPSETINIQNYLLQPQNVIPEEYRWHSYMIPLDPSAILANDSVVSMFDFINISNITESDEDEEGDTLFLPYGIIDTAFDLPDFVGENSGRIHENDETIHYMHSIFPITDQFTDASALAIDWDDLPHQNNIKGPVAPRSFAESAAAYAAAILHDDTLSELSSQENQSFQDLSSKDRQSFPKLPQKDQQSFQVFSLDENGNSHPMNEDEPYEKHIHHKESSRPNGYDEHITANTRQKSRYRTPSRRITRPYNEAVKPKEAKFETPSETAYQHFRSASLPRRYPEVPHYHSFKYDVQDLRGNYYGHEEVKDLLKTTGRYYVLLPDGRLQTVTYYANSTGYYPRVVYTNIATNPHVLKHKYKRIFIPKYPSNPLINTARPTIIPSKHTIVTTSTSYPRIKTARPTVFPAKHTVITTLSPSPDIRHPTVPPIKPTLSPVPVTFSTTPKVIHRVHHFPVPPRNEPYVSNYLTRHWFQTLRPPFPEIGHLRHGFPMPLFKPFYSIYNPRSHQLLGPVTTTALPHLHPVSSTLQPIPPPLPVTTIIPNLPPTTPITPHPPTLVPTVIPHRPTPPPPPRLILNNPPIKSPNPSIPLTPIPTISVLVTPKSAPRPPSHPKAHKTLTTHPPSPTPKPVLSTNHRTSSSVPRFTPPYVTTSKPHPTLRPVLVTSPSPVPNFQTTVISTSLPHPGSSPLIPLAPSRFPERLSLTPPTLRPLHTVATPHPATDDFHHTHLHNTPNVNHLRIHSPRIPSYTLGHIGPHHTLPFHPLVFRSHLHPGDLPGENQLLGYVNAEQLILTNPRIHLFHSPPHQHTTSYPIQSPLTSLHSRNNSPFQYNHSAAPPLVSTSYPEKNQHAEKEIRTHHLNTKPEEENKKDKTKRPVFTISDELAEYDEAAKEYL
ncbi:hypothetical protein SK128_026160 [Halocaridina rubra]|uniref:Uncharacterized protein n=1 Tax=Halocaridina rubra TaxID=373956 RepID=A0AAN8X082_HALRR